MDDGERRRRRALCVESDEVENSDESSESRPSGERWAPVGANDGDNEFADEYKYANVDKYVVRTKHSFVSSSRSSLKIYLKL